MAVSSAKAARTSFACSECGHESPKWLGRCPGCASWNSFVDAIGNRQKVNGGRPAPVAATAVELAHLPDQDQARLPSGVPEFDRVLGGRIVAGSLVLVGGDPDRKVDPHLQITATGGQPEKETMLNGL